MARSGDGGQPGKTLRKKQAADRNAALVTVITVINDSSRKELSFAYWRVALMEAMTAGLPCVVSDIRGNRELVDAAL